MKAFASYHPCLLYTSYQNPHQSIGASFRDDKTAHKNQGRLLRKDRIFRFSNKGIRRIFPIVPKKGSSSQRVHYGIA